jgi:hypothetical protein
MLYCLSGIRTHNVSGDRYWLQIVVNPTTIRSPPRWSLNLNINKMNILIY